MVEPHKDSEMTTLLLLWGIGNMIIIVSLIKDKPIKHDGSVTDSNITIIYRMNYLETLKRKKHSYE